MNENTKTYLIAALLAATVLVGLATVVIPFAGELAAGAAVVGALIFMGFLDAKKRAY